VQYWEKHLWQQQQHVVSRRYCCCCDWLGFWNVLVHIESMTILAIRMMLVLLLPTLVTIVDVVSSLGIEIEQYSVQLLLLFCFQDVLGRRQ
jgi:ABC-type long-subunit fatty acid transport system fused permease/ATPase subunit